MSELKKDEYKVDAVVSFYAIFHTPRDKHLELFKISTLTLRKVDFYLLLWLPMTRLQKKMIFVVQKFTGAIMMLKK